MEDDEAYIMVSVDGSDVEVNSLDSAISASGMLNTNAVPICVPIVSYETLEARSRITIFKLHVDSRFYIHRSYTDFCRLREKLSKSFPGFRAPLPPKGWLRQFQHDFLDKRRAGLQTFLDQILGHAEIAQSPIVKEFLCLDGVSDSAMDNDPEQQSYSFEEELEMYNQMLAEKDEMIADLLRENELLQNQRASLMEASRLERQYFREKLEELQQQMVRYGRRNCFSLPTELERSGDAPASTCSRCNRNKTCSLDNLFPNTSQ